MHKVTKHLPSFGWQPTVLTLKESSYESYLKIDSSLLADVSPGLPIIRTGVIRILTPVLHFTKMALLSIPGRIADLSRKVSFGK